MYISFDEEEINKFPKDIKKFLLNYINQKMDSQIEEGKKFQIEDEEGFRTNDKINFLDGQGLTEANEKFLKYRNRILISSKYFDWSKLLLDEFTSLHSDFNNEFEIIKQNNKFTFNFCTNEGYFNPEKPSDWGRGFIFCCLFGFGGLVPGFSRAETPKQLAKNIEKTGLTNGNPVDPKIIGPLLKSLTTYIITWAYNNYGIVPGIELHWFDIVKKTNQFYYAGDTLKNCTDAVRSMIGEDGTYSLIVKNKNETW